MGLNMETKPQRIELKRLFFKKSSRETAFLEHPSSSFFQSESTLYLSDLQVLNPSGHIYPNYGVY